MLLTRHFVFVHVPKTGGNFVLKVLADHAPADWELQRVDDHATVADIPPSHLHLPRLAFVRNPFSWYVSWFHFQQREQDPFFLQVSDGGRRSFAETMHYAFTGDGPLAASAGALTTTLFEMLGDGLAGAQIGRMEAIRTELLALLGACTELPTPLRRAIRFEPRRNTSAHHHYSHYYDDELRAVIRTKDAPVFEFFGYEWEDGPAG